MLFRSLKRQKERKTTGKTGMGRARALKHHHIVMKTFLEWTYNGVNLEDWINENTKLLEKARIFYVLQANSDKGKITKIGIAGTKSGHPITRLFEYVHFHGCNNKHNPAQGVKLLAVYGAGFDPTVYSKSSSVYTLEKQIKTKIKENAKLVKRGSERTSFNLRHLYDILSERKLHEDARIETRKSARIKVIDKTNKVIKSLS